jgi:hypothetical protein
MKKILFSLLLFFVFVVPAFPQMMDMPMRGHRGGHGQMMVMTEGDMMCMEHARHLGLNEAHSQRNAKKADSIQS